MTTDTPGPAEAERTPRGAGRRAAARELRAWAALLPWWNPLDPETWDSFHQRRQVAEEALVARLRSLPRCKLAISPNGVQAELTLAGLRVRSDAGLRGVCAAWAMEADGSWLKPHPRSRP
jgi:hypothetical protein